MPAGAADNILIAWPVILQFIATHGPDLHGSRVLDYGCGVGSFAQHLHEHGAQVTGNDRRLWHRIDRRLTRDRAARARWRMPCAATLGSASPGRSRRGRDPDSVRARSSQWTRTQGTTGNVPSVAMGVVMKGCGDDQFVISSTT
jgi:hypothetical protein